MTELVSLLNGPVYLPSHVREALGRQICDLRNPRFRDAAAFCRRETAALWNAEGYAVVLASGSGTFGVELVLRSCLGPADQAVALVTGTFSRRLADMAALTGARVHALEAEWGDVVPLDHVARALKETRPAFLLAAHVEPSTATQVDLPALADLCRAHGATLIVDGVCAGFALEVDCLRDNIGAYITASQKGLALPPGMAVAAVSPALLERAKAAPESRTGLYGHILRWTAESPSFTPPILHIFAMEESLRHIRRETMPRRAQRHLAQARRVRAWGAAHGLTPVPVRDSVAAWTLSAFHYPPGLDDRWLISLRDEQGLELAPSNDPRRPGAYFRIGHLGDLPETHLTQGLGILDEALSKARIPS